jgi:hypothetical protein
MFGVLMDEALAVGAAADAVDSVGVKQLSEQQSRRPRANDCYFCPQYLPP